MPPNKKKKKVLLVRHGESTWNVLQQTYPSEDERFTPIMYTPDAPLTDLGIKQSRQVGKSLSIQEETSSYAVVVSPLRRALQTTNHMLHELTADGQPPPCQVVVRSEAAEVMLDVCDVGAVSIHELQKTFPTFDFRHLEKECWWAYGKSLEETWQQMKNRQLGGAESDEMVAQRLNVLKTFVKSIMEDVDTVIIVCHSDIIWWLTKEEKYGEMFGTKAENGEVVDATEHFNLD